MKANLNQLCQHACQKQIVVMNSSENGLQVFAYPVESGVVLGLGYGRDLAHRVNAEKLLQMRSQNMARYGTWLPARFADGSIYVLRRLSFDSHKGGNMDVGEDDLEKAQELFA